MADVLLVGAIISAIVAGVVAYADRHQNPHNKVEDTILDESEISTSSLR